MVTSNDYEKKIIGAEKIYKPAGCEKCNGTGYFGRIALHEILQVKKSVKDLILYSRNLDKIREAAMETGLETLAFDGIEKIRAGLTTLEELQRVLGEENFNIAVQNH